MACLYLLISFYYLFSFAKWDLMWTCLCFAIPALWMSYTSVNILIQIKSIFNEQAHIKRVVCLKLTTEQCWFFFNLLCVGHLFPMWYYIFNIYCLQTNCKSKYAYWLFCACIFLPFLAGTYWVISASSIAFPISSGICVK